MTEGKLTLAAPTSATSPRPRSLRWVAVWRRNALVWRKLAIASLLGNFGEPLLYLLALGYGLGALVGEVSGMPYVQYLASGIVCSSAMMTATFEGAYSAYSRLGPQRTWDAITNSPIDVADVVSGEIVWAASKSLLSAVCILLVALALDLVAPAAALWVVPIAFVTGLTFAALAMVVTSLARSYDVFLYYTTLFVTPSLLMSGVFFPLEQMPPLIQRLADWTPLAHVVALVRALLTGAQPGVAATVAHLLVPLVYCALAWLVAARIASRRLAR